MVYPRFATPSSSHDTAGRELTAGSPHSVVHQVLTLADGANLPGMGRAPTWSSRASAYLYRSNTLQDFATQASSQRFATRASLGFTGLCVMVTLLIMLGVQLMTREIWTECQPGVPCKWAKTQRETIADVIHTRVPKVKQYAKDRDFSYLGADKSAGLYDPKRNCVHSFVEGFKARVGNLSSQPKLVHELFSILHLENSTTARAVVTDLWDTSVDFEPMVDQIATHGPWVQTAPHAWLCMAVAPDPDVRSRKTHTQDVLGGNRMHDSFYTRTGVYGGTGRSTRRCALGSTSLRWPLSSSRLQVTPRTPTASALRCMKCWYSNALHRCPKCVKRVADYAARALCSYSAAS